MLKEIYSDSGSQNKKSKRNCTFKVMKRKWILLAMAALAFSSCELNETPKATATEEDVFGSENGLAAYSRSFYGMLPDASNAYNRDAMADYGAVNNLNSFIREGGYSPETSDGWSWGDLRNINYFIEHCTDPNVSEAVRNNYIGIARFFRAYFYLDKVMRFGDVPWVDHALGIDETDILYGTRDSRAVVMEHVMEDLDFASQNISSTSSDGSLITKWTALGLKTRAALFEASYRKYHPELNFQESANTFYQYVVDAATELMENGPYSLYTGAGVEGSQRALFISDAPLTQEVMWAVTMSEDLAVMSSANWWWTSATYGPRYSLVRPFINTILNLDGTPYTSRTDFQTEEFYDECQNRDYRLAQLIRTPGYSRKGVAAPPNFSSHTYTGYQPIKYILDDPHYDNGAYNTNAIPLMRYAEILLNFAEAKAELGTLTDADWAKSIGALRARAGITGGLTTLPTTVDTYLQQTFFPDISNPIILEVRRERQVELALEGFRFNDLKRWKHGELMANLQWSGIYVPALNVLMDLDHNGSYDVVFYDGNTEGPTIAVPSGCAKVAIGGKSTNYQTLTANRHLEWFKAQPRKWYEDGRQYLYPIPSTAIVKNNNLSQNPGW
ncbi:MULTISPECIES: RagB/SusD family nutrient uptake outer membrane protein [Olivibacter]|uniref:RagB/SusD family nutrient uptake outer membrane protein n=2 Tax=Olivibacter TaxID=376469 RepID=A0ABV6HDA0_9SPHI|nr:MULTISPECIES: RagB/SusD family nutrient uptake outer membrane protein [Olivibacter]